MLELLSEHACFGGVQRFYRHHSQAIGLPMRFSVFLPPQAATAKVPALFYLAGLTCSEETFMIKAGAQRSAAQTGLMLIAPDTSPRNAAIPGEAESWDLGLAAGFYVDATEQPWAKHYRMYSYILELRALLLAEFPVHAGAIGICGHSMGGHGALVLGLRNPQLFQSISALAPICAPCQVPWGRKALQAYLGPDEHAWQMYDASQIMTSQTASWPKNRPILIDQGLADQFLANQLLPEVFEAACAKVAQPIQLRRHAGYDHGYYFIASFIEEHIRFHADILAAC